jgi:hypothetical protein
MMTQLERDREALVKDILKMADDFRTANKMDRDDILVTDIPAGAKYLITQRNVEFLKVMNIMISED